MKKTLFTLLVASVAAGTTAWAAGPAPVYSVNAVGLVNVDVPAGKLALVAVNFDPVGSTGNDSGISIQDLLAGQLTGGGSASEGDNILLWDSVNQVYDLYFLAAGTGDPVYDGKWVRNSDLSVATNMLKNGEGFWIRSNQAGNQTVTLSGQVVDLPSKTNTMEFGAGMSMFSYPFSATVNMNSNELWKYATGGGSASEGDNIIVWDKAAQVYDLYFLAAGTGDPVYDGKWVRNADLSVSTNDFQIGTGYWFRRQNAGSVTWQESEPYSLK
jgi:hypothetical protein